MLSTFGFGRRHKGRPDSGDLGGPPAATPGQGRKAPGPAREADEPARRAWRVPAPSRVFLGRDGLLEEVHDRLGSAGTVVLSGPDGVGKTSLAVAFANRHREDYDVVWWIQARQPVLVGQQILALAAALHLDLATTRDVTAARLAVADYLRSHDRWLLIGDDADDVADLAGWLPDGPGHLLLAATDGASWGQRGQCLQVGGLDTGQAVTLLCRLAPTLNADKELAGQVAQRLAGLPLALLAAGGALSQAGIPAPGYLAALEARLADVNSGAPEAELAVTAEEPLTAALQIARNALAAKDDAAAGLLDVCAQLAPEPIPLTWFAHALSGAPEVFPPALAQTAATAGRLLALAAQLTAFGLAASGEAVTVHARTAQLVRQTPALEPTARLRVAAAAVVVAAAPGDPADPKTWPSWAATMPHLIAQDLATTPDPALRRLACDGLHLLFRQGSADQSRDLATPLRQAWTSTLGGDHPDTLDCAGHLARALRMSAQTSLAKDVLEDTLARRTRVLGEDHPDTLTCAHDYAGTLYVRGETVRAREVLEDALARRIRVLGEDHPDTLTSAHSLAADLRLLGLTEEAKEMDEDTLARRRRVLGDSHPDTLASAHNLAADLRVLGQADLAKEMDQDTLNRRRRVLGESHPNTLASAHNLAADLRDLGEAPSG
jgi:hypothetical protein